MESAQNRNTEFNNAVVTTILVNYNKPELTISCLKSLLAIAYPKLRILICDNHSSDDSIAKIQEWWRTNVNENQELELGVVHENNIDSANISHYNYLLIQLARNKGFAAANNIAITMALSFGTDFIWILNNDTLVTRDTLFSLLDHMKWKNTNCILGSKIVDVDNPQHIQFWGGGHLRKTSARCHATTAPHQDLDYIVGTSMFTSSHVFREIGLFDELFFFYWEDVDISYRAKRRGFHLEAVGESVVAHYGGASTKNQNGQSLFSDLYSIKSRVLFFRKHNLLRKSILGITFVTFKLLVKRMINGQWNRVVPIYKTYYNSLFLKQSN